MHLGCKPEGYSRPSTAPNEAVIQQTPSVFLGFSLNFCSLFLSVNNFNSFCHLVKLD